MLRQRLPESFHCVVRLQRSEKSSSATPTQIPETTAIKTWFQPLRLQLRLPGLGLDLLLAPTSRNQGPRRLKSKLQPLRALRAAPSHLWCTTRTVTSRWESEPDRAPRGRVQQQRRRPLVQARAELVPLPRLTISRNLQRFGCVPAAVASVLIVPALCVCRLR